MGAMRKRSRVRRVLKWGGTVMCSLILLGYVVCLFGDVGWTFGADSFPRDRAVVFYMGEGAIVVSYTVREPGCDKCQEGSHLNGFRARSDKLSLTWRSWWWFDHWGRRGYSVWIYPPFKTWRFMTPLWLPFVIVLIPTALLWHPGIRRWYRNRRLGPGHCQECGYNLTGNVSGVCPECGERI